jgi:hypothetical protein
MDLTWVLVRMMAKNATKVGAPVAATITLR